MATTIKIKRPDGRPRFDDDDGPLVMNWLTVFETEEPAGYTSALLDADGDPIIYEFRSPRQGFVGFVKPSWCDEEEDEKEAEKESGAAQED